MKTELEETQESIKATDNEKNKNRRERRGNLKI